MAWCELLKTEVLGELGDPVMEPHVDHVLRELIVRLKDNAGRVRIVHGLQRDGDKQNYIIDGDFFTDTRTNPEAVVNVLDIFNRRAGNLFRYYITPKLHDAMGPREPET